MKELLIKLKSIDQNIELGKMMSCDGLTYKGKVFCFEYKDKMVFKLGKGYDIKQHGIENYSHLSPFKTKGPMLAWFELDNSYQTHFEELAIKALEVMKHA